MKAGRAGREFLLRRMTVADLPRVMRIERAAFRHPWPRSSFEKELGVPFSRCLVAHPRGDEARVAGYLVRWLVADEIHLLNVATARWARRRGLGRRLVRGLLAEARRGGARVVLLEVEEGNAPARALYESLGFRVVRRRRDYYAPGEHALLEEWAPG